MNKLKYYMGKIPCKQNVGVLFLGIISLAVWSIGLLKKDFNIALVGLLLLYGINVLYGIKNFSKSFLYLFMQITIFTFLLSRSFIGLCRGTEWWNTASQAKENIWFALKLLFLTETALLVGSNLADRIYRTKKAINKKHEDTSNMAEAMRIVSFMIFLVSMFFYLLEQFEPVLAIGTGNYLEYYTNFTSKLPGIVHTAASFMKYSLCIFLATLPSKKMAIMPLILYVFSTLPSLLIGVRNPFVLSLFFALSYFLLRDYLVDDKKWIGKVEKGIIIICTPLLMLFMVVYASVRSGAGIKIGNFLGMISEFFYSQGVSFDVLCIGYGYTSGLKNLKPVNYTFGGIIDYLYRGSVGQTIFHTEPLTSYNSIFNAENSNSLSHALSYLSMKDQYLEGRGRGSSYLLEVATDFGFIGVFIFSVLLGALLLYMVYGFGKKMLVNTIILACLQNIFFIPRAEATGWLTFIVTLQFWMCVAGCYFCVYWWQKWKLSEWFKDHVKRRRK
ncbi:O-antigen polysaccharide polymerase Wzy family protein [Mediterraneibacter massiliensis]|uniref:O-antigen polysaccharide polymerase Wzy family protein n=1 Tax=Mediterraneibacter massiliensis TaxID=1720300 RepID=UPI00073E962F|nr:O-antigen polysaccharide polymerase Wzy family protein [Mediterraneibacter massiliensis]